MKDIKNQCTATHLIQAQLASETNNTRLCQSHLQLCLEQPAYDSDLIYGRSLARQHLITIYTDQKNEEGIKELLEQATEERDDDIPKRNEKLVREI